VALPGQHLTHAKFDAIEQATNVWPLTVDSGTLSCVEVSQRGQRAFAVVFTTDDGNQYALNGTAENTRRFHPGVEIYLPSVFSPRPSPDATWLIGHGLQLCPHYRPWRVAGAHRRPGLPY
jgi:hypothetical protein